MIKDDGDVIRACGFLAIYFGNLEDELDELYGIATSFCSELSDYEHLRFSEKARQLRKSLMQRFKVAPSYPQKIGEESRVKDILQHCKVVAKARNEILHSSIYSDNHGKVMMKNKRQGLRPITSGAVYKLANEVWAMHGAVYGLRFAVTRLSNVMERYGNSPGKRQ